MMNSSVGAITGPGPCVNYFSKTYGPKLLDGKNVGNNFLGIKRALKGNPVQKREVSQSLDQVDFRLYGFKSKI
jgi:hypothetical protein